MFIKKKALESFVEQYEQENIEYEEQIDELENELDKLKWIEKDYNKILNKRRELIPVWANEIFKIQLKWKRYS